MLEDARFCTNLHVHTTESLFSFAATLSESNVWFSSVEPPIPLSLRSPLPLKGADCTPPIPPMPLSPKGVGHAHFDPTLTDPSLPLTLRAKRCSTIAEETDHEVQHKRISTCSSVFTSGDDDAFEDAAPTGGTRASGNQAEDAGPLRTQNGVSPHLRPFGNRRSSEYEVHYEALLKRSVQLWKEIQRERRETGSVDQRKIAALNLFL